MKHCMTNSGARAKDRQGWQGEGINRRRKEEEKRTRRGGSQGPTTQPPSHPVTQPPSHPAIQLHSRTGSHRKVRHTAVRKGKSQRQKGRRDNSS